MSLSDSLIALLRFDLDAREERLREVVAARLGERPVPRSEAHVVATYFFALRASTLDRLGGELAYHATSGTRHPPRGSLLAECTGEVPGADAGRSGHLDCADAESSGACVRQGRHAVQ